MDLVDFQVYMRSHEFKATLLDLFNDRQFKERVQKILVNDKVRNLYTTGLVGESQVAQDFDDEKQRNLMNYLKPTYGSKWFFARDVKEYVSKSFGYQLSGVEMGHILIRMAREGKLERRASPGAPNRYRICILGESNDSSND